MFRSALLLAGLASSAFASYHCIDFTAPITVTAVSAEVAFPEFQNQFEATAFAAAVLGRDSAQLASTAFKGEQNVTSTFEISARYCTPAKKGSGIVQVLTHGLGFDKVYWEFDGPSSPYNYVKVATGAGYSTLAYDRIGNGESTVSDPYNINQGPTELAVLAALTTALRAGALHSGIAKPKTVVHVGHSYGSELSHGLASAAPQLTDGLILTGYSSNDSFQPIWAASTTFHLASVNQPKRFGSRNSGYLTWPDEYANEFGFFLYPHFDPAVLAKAEATKYPFTVGEFLTQALIPMGKVGITGPVLVSLLRFVEWHIAWSFV